MSQEHASHAETVSTIWVNIAPLPNAGLLAADVLAKKDVDQAIADRAEGRRDEPRESAKADFPSPAGGRKLDLVRRQCWRENCAWEEGK